MSFRPNDRKFLPEGRDVTAAIALIEEEYREHVPKALRRDPRSDKEIARALGTTPRTVRNWRNQANGMTVPHFIAACREIPALAALARRWLNAAAELDPDQEFIADELIRAARKVLSRNQELLRERLDSES